MGREDRTQTAFPLLSEAVDSGALTALLESPAAVTVRLEYQGYVILIVIGPGPNEVAVIDPSYYPTPRAEQLLPLYR